MRRIKLFSRVKLFSKCEEILNTVTCRDCGTELETTANVSHILCPKCGGDRFNVKQNPVSPIGTPERVEYSLFKKDEDLSNPSNRYEEKLKKFSGNTVELGAVQREFSNIGDLLQKGYAQIADSGNVTFSPDAYITEKIFSKLTITVTKELDLDPEITEQRKPFVDIVEGLRDSGDIPERGIILIKKAHNPLQTVPSDLHESRFSCCESEEWVKDSRIESDLKTEYGNTSMGIKQFLAILENRYPDAPDNLLDILTENGVIRIEGNQVTISK